MDSIIKFLRDPGVIGWIAPIITTVFIPVIVKLIFKKINTQKTINVVTVANSKILEALRPLFIQKIYVDKKLLNDIISAISMEYDLDINMLINIKQIKEKLVYDISVTRFMDEKEKIDRINNLYKNFSDYGYDYNNCGKENIVNLNNGNIFGVVGNIKSIPKLRKINNIDRLNKEKEKLRILNQKIVIICSIIAIIIFSEVVIYNYNFIVDNLLLIITITGIIFTIISFYITINSIEK